MRAANLGFVVVFSRVDPKDGVSVHFAVSPTLGVRHFPAFESLLKVFAENQREFLAGKGSDGEGREGDDRENELIHGMRILFAVGDRGKLVWNFEVQRTSSECRLGDKTFRPWFVGPLGQ